ncbi:MAG: EamA family transporter [Dehalococcoidia bacterium]|nr:EamA family transporter [Dehalococcoidia bacterium]
MKPLHLVLLVFQGALVGSSFLMIKVVVDDISPALVVAGRLVLAASLAFAIVLAMRLPMLATRSGYGILFLIGALGLALPFLMVTWAQTRVSSGTTSVLSSAIPIVTACLAVWLLRDERLTKSKVIGLAVGFVGVAVLSGGDFLDLGGSVLIGDLAVIGSVLCFAASTVAVRRFLRDENPMTVSAFNLLFAAIVSIPVAVATEPPDRLLVLDEVEWAAFLTLGLGTGVVNSLFYWLMVRIGAIKVSMTAYITPATGVLLGWLVLDEVVNWYMSIGFACIIAGIAMATGMLSVERLGDRLLPGRKRRALAISADSSTRGPSTRR